MEQATWVFDVQSNKALEDRSSLCFFSFPPVNPGEPLPQFFSQVSSIFDGFEAGTQKSQNEIKYWSQNLDAKKRQWF